MTQPPIMVFRDKFVAAQDGPRDAGRARLVAAGDAFTQPYPTDAHCTQYISPTQRRLSRRHVGIVVPQLNWIMLDIDCPDAHGSATPAPPEWRNETRARVRTFAERCGSMPFCFDTRHGSRIVFRLRNPICVRNEEGARSWPRFYAVVATYVRRNFGLEADLACCDWQRLFRLPHATRIGKAPEEWPTLGDPYRIGSLHIAPSADDISEAKRTCKAFRPRPHIDFTASAGDGYGLLYHALRARNTIVRAHGENAFVIRCPREHLHSCGRTGDGSTLLYLPPPGHELGAIHCLHSHCADLTQRDWRCEFDPSELKAARIAAGLRSRAS
jgi:hypothetical protein